MREIELRIADDLDPDFQQRKKLHSVLVIVAVIYNGTTPGGPVTWETPTDKLVEVHAREPFLGVVEHAQHADAERRRDVAAAEQSAQATLDFIRRRGD